MTEGGPFWELFLSRMREFVREPEVVFWVFGFPILLSLGLGIAFRERTDQKVPVGVVERPGAERIALALPEGGGFEVVRLDEGEAARRLRLGKIALVVVPDGTANPAGVEYRFDPTRAESTLARLRVDDALQRAAGRGDAVAVHQREVTEPGARYIDFLIPGLLGMNIMSGGMWGVGYALVEMRVRKLLKRLAATPMRRGHFLGAMMASRMVLVLLEIVVLLGFGWIVFDLAVRGSLLVIAVVSFVGAFSFSGLALLVASRAKKAETVSGLMNLVMLPMFVFSGTFFSAERFPAALQPAIQALPLTALNDALRGVILDGTGLLAQTGEIVLLLVWGGVSFILALRVFRWT